VHTRVHVPIPLAWEALRAALAELEAKPGSAALHVTIPGPVEAHLSAPIAIHTADGNSGYERKIRIVAAAQQRLFPEFKGVIWLVHTLVNACDLRLEGWYRVPLNAAGLAIDATLLRNAASESLRGFVDDLGRNIAGRIKVVS
jgi:hypothetical protein